MLTVDVLIAPPQGTGALAPSLFPGDGAGVFEDRLETYLKDGYARAAAIVLADDPDAQVRQQAARDDAAVAWAEHRAYRARYLDALNTAASATVEGGSSETFTREQIDGWRTLADEALARFQGIVAAATVGISGAFAPPLASRAVPITVVW